ncbi:MAG: hypothetical protein ACRDUY_03775 [Nitriliruptorales bacterium]
MTLTVRIGGLVSIRLTGLELLGRETARWAKEALGPLATAEAGPVDATIEIRADTPAPGRRIEHGLALVDGAIWIGDGFGRGGIVRLDADVRAQVDPSVSPSVLGDRLYFLLLRVALARRGAVLLRAGAVEVAGRRIVATGWSGAGKSRLVLTLLARHGGRLIGDDVVAVLPDGRIAPAVADVTIRPEHRDLVHLPGTGRVAALRAAAATGLEHLGRRAPRMQGLAKVSGGVAEVLRQGGERIVGVSRVVPAGLAEPGRIDTLVLLRDAVGADPVEFLVGIERTYLLAHEAVEAVARATGMVDAATVLLPADHDRRAAVTAALAGVRVVERQPPLMPGDAEALAAELVR